MTPILVVPRMSNTLVRDNSLAFLWHFESFVGTGLHDSHTGICKVVPGSRQVCRHTGLAYPRVASPKLGPASLFGPSADCVRTLFSSYVTFDKNGQHCGCI